MGLRWGGSDETAPRGSEVSDWTSGASVVHLPPLLLSITGDDEVLEPQTTLIPIQPSTVCL